MRSLLRANFVQLLRKQYSTQPPRRYLGRASSMNPARFTIAMADEEDVESAPAPDRAPPERESKTPEISPLRLSLYGREGERRLAQRFHAVRLSKSQRPDPVTLRGRPLIVYLNHSTWWDPLICLQLAREIFPDRRHYGPIDASTVGQYRSFKRMGFFEVDAGSARGA